MPHYTNPKRFWFIDRGKIAFVEEATNSSTVDGVSTNIASISEAKSVKIKAIANALHFTTEETPGNSDEDGLMVSEYDDPTKGPLGEIPNQYHEALVYKVIANGYREPRNLEIQLAQYFDLEYNNIIKNAKKFARSNYQTTGTIVPQDY
jgi:hypothetical protein